MPANAQKGELPEMAMHGPFGGVQSELPLDAIEVLGFRDCVNTILFNGVAQVRPGFTPLTLMPNPQEAILGIADFFTVNAARTQVIMTPTRLLKWDGAGAGSWTQITGALTGGAARFGWTVVNSKLLFSQGVDRVKLWDGATAGFADAAAAAVPARYLMELDTHLVVADTIEGGSRVPQRVRWTSSGDPTDWTTPNAGNNDILNDLGPITGLTKLYQTGYAFHQWGITQIIPTGIGVKPFAFVPMTSKARGSIAPYSLASYGEEFAAYVGKDNIYLFNGTSSEPIGDKRLEGRARIGARTRILADLATADVTKVYGFVSTSFGGVDFNAYILVIPNSSIWVYNLDEANWTRWTFSKLLDTVGVFARAGVPRIIDLIGTIAGQQWTPATLVSTTPFDGMLLGFDDGTPGYVDFTGFSEQAWSITSGQLVMGNSRHQKTVKKFRLLTRDLGAATFTVTISSELGISDTRSVSIGTGSGLVLETVLSFSVPGVFLTWIVSGAAAQPASFVEFAPVYDEGGEVRGG